MFCFVTQVIAGDGLTGAGFRFTFFFLLSLLFFFPVGPRPLTQYLIGRLRRLRVCARSGEGLFMLLAKDGTWNAKHSLARDIARKLKCLKKKKKKKGGVRAPIP